MDGYSIIQFIEDLYRILVPLLKKVVFEVLLDLLLSVDMEGDIVVLILAAVFVAYLMRKWVLYDQTKHTKVLQLAQSPL